MTAPTKEEITSARETAEALPAEIAEDLYRLLLRCWEGKGWHYVDIAIGIIVGLQVAEDRKRHNTPKLKLVGGQPK